jgi:hypothetical protein
MRNLVVLVVLAVAGYFGVKFYIQYKVAKDLDAVLTQARPFVDVSYENVVATMKGELRVKDVTVRLAEFDDELTIESVNVLTPGFFFLMGFDNRARDFEFPKKLGFELIGLRAAVDADFMQEVEELNESRITRELTAADRCASTYNMTPAALKRLGYYEMNMDFRTLFRREGNQLAMDIAAHVEDMYDLDVTLTLGGIGDPTELARGTKPLLVNARLDYVDRSLNSRVLAYCAEQNISAEEVIAAQIIEIETLARSNGMELDAMLIDPYTEFLRGKQRITVISRPNRPVDLTRISLYKPSDVPNLLNLTAEAI